MTTQPATVKTPINKYRGYGGLHITMEILNLRLTNDGRLVPLEPGYIKKTKKANYVGIRN